MTRCTSARAHRRRVRHGPLAKLEHAEVLSQPKPRSASGPHSIGMRSVSAILEMPRTTSSIVVPISSACSPTDLTACARGAEGVGAVSQMVGG